MTLPHLESLMHEGQMGRLKGSTCVLFPALPEGTPSFFFFYFVSGWDQCV